MVEGKLSHDAITRSLGEQLYGSTQLWQVVKPLVRQIQQDDAVLILDDTVEGKPFMQANNLIRYHYGHCQGKAVKGINQLPALYHSGQNWLPVAFQLIHKDQQTPDAKTAKSKWTSSVSKQAYFRQLVQRCVANQLLFKYVLADSWFSSAENFRFIARLNKHFIMPLKANRKVALSEADHHQGRYQPIGSLSLEEHQSFAVWVESVDFPLVLTRQIFKDGDRQQGQLYLVTNDLRADSADIQTQYARRWKVEEFHKSVKSNAGYGQSPAHTVRTQSTHLFLSMLAFVKLEALRLSSSRNHFALRKLLAHNALKMAMSDLHRLKSRSTLLAKAA